MAESVSHTPILFFIQHYIFFSLKDMRQLNSHPKVESVALGVLKLLNFKVKRIKILISALCATLST